MTETAATEATSTGKTTSSCKVIASANQKGGVGKTSTTYHLARAAMLKGLKVLCIDLDPQGNLTSVLAPEITEEDAGLAEALSTRSPGTLDDVIVSTIWDGVELAPTVGDALGYVRDELVIAGTGRESRLRAALDSVKNNYDLVLIDCSPSLDQLTINGLVASDGVLIVTQSKLWSANGLARLLGTIKGVREHYNKDLAISGILVNQHESGTTSGGYWLEEVTASMTAQGLHVFNPPVPKRVAISDAHESGSGLDEFSSKEAQALADLYSTHLATILKEV